MPISEIADDDAQRRFQKLVERHLGSLLRFAQRRSATVSDAEDAVQEACLRAWMAFSDLRDGSKVRAWLYRILRTVLSDGLARDGRRLRLAGTMPIDDVPEADLATEVDAVFTDVMARLSREAVYDALATLPPDFGAAVELHDIDGLKYHEIAEVLEVPVGTVMSRISRGRRLLARAVSVRGASPAVAEQRVVALRRG